jgi:hypothetical protein
MRRAYRRLLRARIALLLVADIAELTPYTDNAPVSFKFYALKEKTDANPGGPAYGLICFRHGRRRLRIATSASRYPGNLDSTTIGPCRGLKAIGIPRKRCLLEARGVPDH